MIIEKAQELGLALSESEEFRAMMDAQAAVDANASIQALMEQYTQKRETIVSMMEQDQGDKDTLMELGRELDEIPKHPINRSHFPSHGGSATEFSIPHAAGE